MVSGSLLDLENFLAAVIAASLANAMAENDLTALGTLGHAGENELPVVGTSLISASLGYFLLWYCHYLHLLEALNTWFILINCFRLCLCQTELQG